MVAAQIQPKSVLSVDIVDFSSRQTHDMAYILDKLYRYIASAIPDGRNTISYRTWRPMRDGGSLSFDFVEDSLKTAIHLLRLIDLHNQAEDNTRHLLTIRVGLDFGPVFPRRDYDDEGVSVWGHGVTVSTQVCGLAEPGEILASRRYCEVANLIDNNGRSIEYQAATGLPAIAVRQRGRWWLKHGYSVEVYNLTTAEVGVQPVEAHPWYTPYKAPIDSAIDTYNKMLTDHDDINEPKDLQNAFRAVMIVKRLLDLQQSDDSNLASDIIEKISRATENRISHLRHWLFSRLPRADLEFWLRRAEFKTYPAGEQVFEIGETAHYIYIIVHGTLQARIGEHLLDDLTEGDIFGEMALFTPGRTRTATIVATLKATVLRIDYRHLHPGVDPYASVQAGRHQRAYERSARIKQVLYQMLYAPRTVINTLRSHPVFAHLNDDLLQRFDPSEVGVRLLPERMGDQIELRPRQVWGEGVGIIVSGQIEARHRNQQFRATYTMYDLIGLNGLQMQCPFERLDIEPDTQLILIPTHLLDDVLKNVSETSDFALALLEEHETEAEHKWYGTLEPLE